MARTLINAPATARRGEVIEIRATIAHPMETGFRRNNLGHWYFRYPSNRNRDGMDWI